MIARGSQIPQAIDASIKTNLFVQEDFDDVVLAAAGNGDSVGKFLKELQEPRPNEQGCIPWMGETYVKEKLIRSCSAVGSWPLIVTNERSFDMTLLVWALYA